MSPNVRSVSLEVFPVTPMPNRGPEARAVTGTKNDTPLRVEPMLGAALAPLTANTPSVPVLPARSVQPAATDSRAAPGVLCARPSRRRPVQRN